MQVPSEVRDDVRSPRDGVTGGCVLIHMRARSLALCNNHICSPLSRTSRQYL